MSEEKSIRDLAISLEYAKYEPTDFFAGLFAVGQVSVLASEPGTGKTWFMLYSIMQASVGHDVFGNEGKVYSAVCFNGETSDKAFRNRYCAVRDGGLKHDLDKMIFFDRDNISLKENFTGSLFEDDSFKKFIHSTMQEIKPDAVIFDSLVSFNTGDENSAKDMSAVFSWLLKLAKRYNTAVIVIHHMRKKSNQDNSKKRTMDDIIGSSAITRLIGLAYKMERLSHTSSSSSSSSLIGESSSSSQNKVLITCVKSNVDRMKPPFVFIMNSEGNGENEAITFEVRDAKENEIIPATQETLTQGNRISRIINACLNDNKRKMSTSELVARCQEFFEKPVNERVIKKVIQEMREAGKISQIGKKGREFIYGPAGLDEHDDDDSLSKPEHDDDDLPPF